MKKYSFMLFGLLLLACAKNKPADTFTVFCAAGMTDVVTELADSFMLHHPQQVRLNLASSGTLARQLALGNPADLFIAASERWANYADSLALFSERKMLWQNQLVVVTPVEASAIDSLNFQDPQPPVKVTHLSMGDPTHVPAGIYAQQALQSVGWWASLESKIVPAKDVRSALRTVEMGECEMGIVYYTDALASQKVHIAGTFPDSCHQPIIMHALLAKEAAPGAREFYAMLNDTLYEKIWNKYGLTTVKK